MTSRYRGVSLQPGKVRAPWQAKVRLRGRQVFLGRYAREEQAARAYDAARRLMGVPEAKLNFPYLRESLSPARGRAVVDLGCPDRRCP